MVKDLSRATSLGESKKAKGKQKEENRRRKTHHIRKLKSTVTQKEVRSNENRK